MYDRSGARRSLMTLTHMPCDQPSGCGEAGCAPGAVRVRRIVSGPSCWVVSRRECPMGLVTTAGTNSPGRTAAVAVWALTAVVFECNDALDASVALH